MIGLFVCVCVEGGCHLKVEWNCIVLYIVGERESLVDSGNFIIHSRKGWKYLVVGAQATELHGGLF